MVVPVGGHGHLPHGIVLLGIYASDSSDYLTKYTGPSILTGILFGVTMLANVWMVIWPNQQIVIASVRKQLAGGEADPAQPGAAKKAARASGQHVLLDHDAVVHGLHVALRRPATPTRRAS